jgi:hypothetical protein
LTFPSPYLYSSNKSFFFSLSCLNFPFPFIFLYKILFYKQRPKQSRTSLECRLLKIQIRQISSELPSMGYFFHSLKFHPPPPPFTTFSTLSPHPLPPPPPPEPVLSLQPILVFHVLWLNGCRDVSLIDVRVYRGHAIRTVLSARNTQLHRYCVE